MVSKGQQACTKTTDPTTPGTSPQIAHKYDTVMNELSDDDDDDAGYEIFNVLEFEINSKKYQLLTSVSLLSKTLR